MAHVTDHVGSTKVFVYQHVAIGMQNHCVWGLNQSEGPTQVVLRNSALPIGSLALRILIRGLAQ